MQDATDDVTPPHGPTVEGVDRDTGRHPRVDRAADDSVEGAFNFGAEVRLALARAVLGGIRQLRTECSPHPRVSTEEDAQASGDRVRTEPDPAIRTPDLGDDSPGRSVRYGCSQAAGVPASCFGPGLSG